MAKVITLNGLEANNLKSDCDEVIEVTSTVLKKAYRVCRKDLERLEQRGQAIHIPGSDVTIDPSHLLPAAGKAVVVRGRRGRPKGTTVKAGAKRPRVASCPLFGNKLVRTKTGRKICKCAAPGNSQILPLNRCKE